MPSCRSDQDDARHGARLLVEYIGLRRSFSGDYLLAVNVGIQYTILVRTQLAVDSPQMATKAIETRMYGVGNPIAMLRELDIVALLRKAGWVRISTGADDLQLIESCLRTVASQLGTPITQGSRMVAELVPRSKGTGNPNSLSGRYGLGSFPLHIDNSHWSVPCRYVVLACVTPGSCPSSTLLLDSSEVTLSPGELSLVVSAVFLIRNGRKHTPFTQASGPRAGHFFAWIPGACVQWMEMAREPWNSIAMRCMRNVSIECAWM